MVAFVILLILFHYMETIRVVLLVYLKVTLCNEKYEP